MKPYYEENGITIYNADCREVLPSLGGIVISDPPYNVGYHYAGYADKLSESDYAQLLKDSFPLPSICIHYPEDMFFVSRSLGVIPDKVVSWVYNAHTPRKWRSIAWFGIKPDFSLLQQPFKNLNDKRIRLKLENGISGCSLYDWWQVDQVKNVSFEKTDHPCQIPLEVMRRIIGITEGDTFIDPFMGSGTTLRAAKDLGRKAIGIEIEERYCEIAANRLRQEVLQFEVA